MGLQTTKAKTDTSKKLGYIPQRIDLNKRLRVISVFTGKNRHHDIIVSSNHANLVKYAEIEHLKSNGMIYSKLSRIR